MGNHLDMNPLTNDTQYDYKGNKSTMDVIYTIKRNVNKKVNNGQILNDSTKSLSKINRGFMKNSIGERTTR